MPAILHFFGCAAVLLVAGISLWGWGAAAQRAVRLPAQPAAVTIALGIAAVLALGGALNLLRLAQAPALGLVAAAGLGLGAWFAGAVRWPRLSGVDAWAAALIAGVVGFAIATQLPPAVLNHYDDMEKYLAHPVRMLATGTLAGSPLSALGSSTLGGAAWLQGFVAAVWPIGYVNAVDAVFGLGLLLALAATAGRGSLAPWPGVVLVPLAVALIEPQYVNVTPLYLGAALMAAAMLVTLKTSDGPPLAWALGLLYAGLVALKPVFAVFAAFHLPLTALVRVRAFGAGGHAATWALRAGLAAALALAPWLALYLPAYLSPPVAGAVVPAASTGEPLILWLARGAYGATPAHYVLLAACGVTAAIWAARRGGNPAVAAGALAGVAGGAVFVACGALMGGRDTAVRYAVPLLLGTAPLALGLAVAGSGAPRTHVAAALLAGIAVIFVPAALERYARAWNHGSILAFLDDGLMASPAYARYFGYALSEAAVRETRALQERVPAGEPVLVWILRPYQLDYARNPIIDADPAGLATRWARIPAAVDHVIWEHDGWPVRSPFHYGLEATRPGRGERTVVARARDFARQLEAEVARGDILYRDRRYVVFRRAAGGAGLAPQAPGDAAHAKPDAGDSPRR